MNEGIDKFIFFGGVAMALVIIVITALAVWSTPHRAAAAHIAPVAPSGFPHRHHKHPTATVGPTRTSVPTVTVLPSSTLTPTATARPTRTAIPTSVPVPSPRPSPTPTPTRLPSPSPVPTATAWPTAAPTATALPTTTPPSSCAGTSCTQYLLSLINDARAQAGVPPVALNATQSNGTSTCVGSYGHSVHMAAMGVISHDQWPSDLCVPYTAAGENVGVASTGSEQGDIDTIQRMMMAEPHDSATCATTVNHACNEISPNFHQIGIGLYYSSGTTWLTTDFIG